MGIVRVHVHAYQRESIAEEEKRTPRMNQRVDISQILHMATLKPGQWSSEQSSQRGSNGEYEWT